MEKRAGAGDFLRFSLGILSLGLLLSGNGSPAHIPADSVGTAMDFGKAVDYVVGEKASQKTSLIKDMEIKASKDTSPTPNLESLPKEGLKSKNSREETPIVK